MEIATKLEAFLETNDILDELVRMEQSSFSGSFLSIFRPKPFMEYATELRAYRKRLDQIRDLYSELPDVPLPGVDWQAVDRAFAEFAKQLSERLSFLEHISLNLHKKSEGSQYSYLAYSREMRVYRGRVAAMRITGDTLTRLIRG